MRLVAHSHHRCVPYCLVVALVVVYAQCLPLGEVFSAFDFLPVGIAHAISRHAILKSSWVRIAIVPLSAPL